MSACDCEPRPGRSRAITVVALLLAGTVVVLLTQVRSTPPHELAAANEPQSALTTDASHEISVAESTARHAVELSAESIVAQTAPVSDRAAGAITANVPAQATDEEVAHDDESEVRPPLPNLPPGIRFSEDGRRCVKVGDDGLVRLVNPRTFEVVNETGYKSITGVLDAIGRRLDGHEEPIALTGPIELPEAITKQYQFVKLAPDVDGILAGAGSKSQLLDASGKPYDERYFMMYFVGVGPTGKLTIYGQDGASTPVAVRELP